MTQFPVMMEDNNASAALPKAPGPMWPWLLITAMVLLVYGGCYGWHMVQTTAVPTFDQAAYMAKTYAIADAVYHQPWRIVMPGTYLGAPAANRPPLLPAVAGLLLGPQASALSIGICWLVIRIGILWVALAVLARRVGSAAWTPAAALGIVAQPGWHVLYPNMYMMDQAFEAFALLAFALLVVDLHRRTPRSAAWAAAGTLLLALVKPAAWVLLFPLYVLLLRKIIERHRAEARPGAGAAALRRWLWPYALLAAAFVALYASPHGRAVVEQYQLGDRGYWAWHTAWPARMGMLALVMPPWLLALAGLSLARKTWRNQPVAAAALFAAAWWYVFNAFLTYTLDPRIVPAAAPLAIVALVLVCWRWKPAAVGVTACAAAVCGLSIASSYGVLPARAAGVVGAVAPLPGVQRPIKEVGLLPAARELRQAVLTAPGLHNNRVMLLTSDDFVELAAMKLALRYTGGSEGLFVDAHPWGAADFRLSTMLSFDFFLTKDRRNATALTGDVWTSLNAITALIEEPQSPLHELFVPVATMAIHQPNMNDTLTLWRMTRQPTRAEEVAALRYILPRFQGTKGEGEVEREIAGLGE